MIKDDRVRYDPRRDFYANRRAVQETDRVDQGGWAQALQDRAAGKLGPDGLPLESAVPMDKDGKPLLDSSALNPTGRSAADFNDDDLDWS